MRKTYDLLLGWFRAPSDLELSILYILLGIYLSVATDAVVPACWIIFTLVSLSCIILYMLCRLIIFFLAIRTGTLRKTWTRWGQLGFISLMATLLFLTNVGLIVRVKISENNLVDKAEHILSLPVENQIQFQGLDRVQVGFFAIRIYKVDAVTRTVWFHTEDGEALFWVPSLMGGIVYCEQGKPVKIGETSYQHLWGPWWRWAQDI